MLLKQTGKDVEPGSFERGVLTATNSTLFPAVHATAISLRRQRVPYAVVDHGLTLEQLKTLQDLDVLVLVDNTRIAGSANTSCVYSHIPLKAWHKPFLCRNSPFALTAWVDADAIVLEYAQELFQWPRGFLTMDHFVTDRWAASAYSELVEALGGLEVARVNSGVLTVTPDSRWLDLWIKACARILLDKQLAKLAHCLDQSALIAALAIMPAHVRPVILTQPHWNFPADGKRNFDVTERLRDYPTHGPELLDFTAARHSGASVVHWMGHIKPWSLD